MPCPHNEITIVQRSQRQSAVAAAAYQSGEKLFCEYDQQVKVYENGNISVKFKFADELRKIAEYIEINTTEDTAVAG